jgi:hypothetical protein
MDKKLFPTCLAVVLCCLFSLPLFSAPVSSDECNAPAPGNFRKTAEGPGYVTLGWEPVESGASHLLTVSEVLADGSETLVYTFDGISAVTKKVDGLKQRTRYKFKIYTKCADGNPSLIPSEVDIITLIIELTLAGRKPVNPQPVGCSGIDYQNPEYDWIGFRLQKVKGDVILQENFFEFQREGELVSIKRAETNNKLVAANHLGNAYPRLMNPVIETLIPFRAAELIEGDQMEISAFASIALEFNSGWNETVDICCTYDPGQQLYYKYDVFVSNVTGTESNQGLVRGIQGVDNVKVVNPVQDFIEIISTVGGSFSSEDLMVSLLGIDGRILKQSEERSIDGTIWIDAREIPSGPFFLVISGSTERKTFMLVKI